VNKIPGSYDSILSYGDEEDIRNCARSGEKISLEQNLNEVFMKGLG